MGELICRPATPDDIENIMDLERASFNKFTRESKGIFLERIECFSDGFLVLEDGKTFIGAISSEIWHRYNIILRGGFGLGYSIKKRMDMRGGELYISSFAVLPQYRRMKYGKVLLKVLFENIMKRYPLVKYVLVLVNERWADAKTVYLKYGFCDVRSFDNFFTESDGSKSNGVVMRHDNILTLYNCI